MRQDPLIYKQAVGAPKRAEIGFSGGLSPFTGHPTGTRPISKDTEPIKVKRLRLIFRFAKADHGIDAIASTRARLTTQPAQAATQLGGLSAGT